MAADIRLQVMVAAIPRPAVTAADPLTVADRHTVAVDRTAAEAAAGMGGDIDIAPGILLA